MKNFKIVTSMLVAVLIFIIAGCSDYIANTEEISSDNKVDTGKLRSAGIDLSSYYIQLRLKPHRAYTFNYSNTGLNNFFSIDAKRIYPELKDRCKDIFVHGSIDKKQTILNCQSENFDIQEITVENTGSEIIDLDVLLLGYKNTKNIKSEQ